MEEPPGPLPNSGGTCLLVALHAAVSAIGTLFMVRSRVPSTRSQIAWVAFGAIAGIGTWLAVISVYPRGVYEQCINSDRRRRVDRDRCEHCSAEWPLPDSEGIALIGPRHQDHVLAEQASV